MRRQVRPPRQVWGPEVPEAWEAMAMVRERGCLHTSHLLGCKAGYDGGGRDDARNFGFSGLSWAFRVPGTPESNRK